MVEAGAGTYHPDPLHAATLILSLSLSQIAALHCPTRTMHVLLPAQQRSNSKACQCPKTSLLAWS